MKMEWILTEKKIPKKTGEYIIMYFSPFRAEGDVKVMKYSCERKAWMIGDNYCRTPVAWMPLPKPLTKAEAFIMKDI